MQGETELRWKLSGDRRFLVAWPFKIQKMRDNDYTLFKCVHSVSLYVERVWIGRFKSLAEAKRCANYVANGGDPLAGDLEWDGIVVAEANHLKRETRRAKRLLRETST